MRSDRSVLVAGLIVAGAMACNDPAAPPAAPGSPIEAFIYHKPNLLVAPAGRPFSVATAVMYSQGIVGFAFADTRAVGPAPYLWASPGYAPALLPMGRLGKEGEALSINQQGQIAGWVETSAQRAAYWPSSTSQPVALGTLGTSSWANDINVGTVIVGGYTTPSGVAPFIWEPTHLMRALPLPPGSTGGEARAINDAAVIVGYVMGNSCELAVRWTPLPGGTYSYNYLAPAGTCGLANDINRQGTIVGTAVGSNGKFNAVQFVAGGTPLVLASGGGSAAYGIASFNMIAGVQLVPSDTAFYFDEYDLKPYALYSPGPQRSAALGISEEGVLVGAQYDQSSGFPLKLNLVNPHAIYWTETSIHYPN